MSTQRIVFDGKKFLPQFKGEHEVWFNYSPASEWHDTPSFPTLAEARDFIMQNKRFEVVWEGN